MSADSSDIASRPARVRPGWWIAGAVLIAVVVLFFVSQTIASLAITGYAGLQHMSDAQLNAWLANSTAVQFAYSALAEGLLVIGVWRVLRWLGWRWADIGLRRPKLEHVFYGILAIVPYFAFYIGLVLVISAIVPGLNVGQRQQLGFGATNDPTALVLTFLALVVIPALAEEITMRGLLYTGLKKWLPTFISALVVSALFGAAHLAEGGDTGPLWIGAIDTFSLSMVLVLLREKTGNLWAGVVLHASKNFIAFLSLYIISK